MERTEHGVTAPAPGVARPVPGADGGPGPGRPDPGPAVRLDAVVRRQGAFTLGPLDMSVPSGLVTGFVGPNGAGKTTAIKAMLGMIGIDAGSIDVLGAAPGARHDRVGVVLDTVALPPEWTAVSAAGNLGRFYPGWDRDLFDELLVRLDVPPRVRVKDLSRGQGVKLRLVLALAHRPELLILDEPTSGLDPVARLDVLDVLRDFLVEEGRTILFSTHITSDLEQIADHLHIIGAGRTRFAGPLTDLTEQWAMARGPVSALTPAAEAALAGTRRNGAGAFSGLIRVSDTAAFGPDVVVEPPSIEEAVAAMTRGPRSAYGAARPRPVASAAPAQEH